MEPINIADARAKRGRHAAELSQTVRLAATNAVASALAQRVLPEIHRRISAGLTHEKTEAWPYEAEVLTTKQGCTAFEAAFARLRKQYTAKRGQRVAYRLDFPKPGHVIVTTTIQAIRQY